MKRQRQDHNSSHRDRDGKRDGNKRHEGGGRDFKKSGSFGSFYHQQQQISDAWSQKLHPQVMQSNIGKNMVPYTVSLAIPGSILRNAITRELKTYIVGQIARALVIHEVDEIIIFVDSAAEASAPDPDRTPSVFFCRILQYLECPSYLRKELFPHHNDLQNVGLLPSLDTPHHMRQHDISVYREGVVVGEKLTPDGCYANIGLSSEVYLPKPLRPGVRVTVKLDDAEASNAKDRGTRLTGRPVKPTEPREMHGLYWGYQTRLAKTLSDVFAGCPYVGGYDVTIGNSDNGTALEDSEKLSTPVINKSFKHMLVVFGGVSGMEACVDADETLATRGKDADTLFDLWLNMCPNGGSKQIRTEEAVLVGLAKLKPLIHAARKETRDD